METYRLLAKSSRGPGKRNILNFPFKANKEDFLEIAQKKLNSVTPVPRYWTNIPAVILKPNNTWEPILIIKEKIVIKYSKFYGNIETINLKLIKIKSGFSLSIWEELSDKGIERAREHD